MPRPLPSNNMPWPENLIFDFNLPVDTSPEDAERFIAALETSDRNKAFLRLRYIDSKTYKEIATTYGITPSAVRMAVKYVQEKASATSNHLDDSGSPGEGHTDESQLIVDPARLNGVALIETIRLLFRRVGPSNFEEALSELRDALCSFATQNSDQRGNI